MAKRSKIVYPTFEICLSSKMFDRFATSKNIARPTFFVCVKQKTFLNFFKNITPQICYILSEQFLRNFKRDHILILPQGKHTVPKKLADHHILWSLALNHSSMHAVYWVLSYKAYRCFGLSLSTILEGHYEMCKGTVIGICTKFRWFYSCLIWCSYIFCLFLFQDVLEDENIKLETLFLLSLISDVIKVGLVLQIGLYYLSRSYRYWV